MLSLTRGPAMDESNALSVRGLYTAVPAPEGVVRAVRGVSFDVARGESLGLVGESGCGKSMTALSIVRLLPAGAKITAGSILVEGQDVVRASDREMRQLRGGSVAM